MDSTFSTGVINLLGKLNKVTVKDALKRGCLPFFVGDKQVGLIRPDFWIHLQKYPDILQHVETHSATEKQAGIYLSDTFATYKDRTDAVAGMLEDLRNKDVIPCLRGWRDENYKVSQSYTEPALLEVERSASGLFGFIQYGVHINGYTVSDKGQLCMWIGRRSKTKQTFPDMFDNMCAGGLPADLGVVECARKECQEEGSVSDQLLDGLKSTGTISYFYEDERGLQPESQFIFDLELPSDFKPVNADGEMSGFQLVTMDELKSLMFSGNFKPNCAAVCLDFLIRHGLLGPDEDHNFSYYVEQLHTPLQGYFTGK